MKLKKYQKHIILEEPIVFNKERVLPSKGAIVEEANDKYYIETPTFSPIADIILGIGFMGGGGWPLYKYYNEERNLLDLLFLIMALVGLLFFIYALTAKKKYKKLILDRMNGIITYPDSFYGKPLKGPFKELKVVISVTGHIDGHAPREYLKIDNTFRPRFIDPFKTISIRDPRKQWSFMVWYMDKNRPLPPGTAFDPYRQKDFERRKAEGFPKPLYPSEIPTPEATLLQQKERERYWRDPIVLVAKKAKK